MEEIQGNAFFPRIFLYIYLYLTLPLLRQLYYIGAFLLFFCLHGKGQTPDVREPFLGLYYTNAPPCISPSEQNPPDHYVMVQKDSTSTDSIMVIDTLYNGPTGFAHHCKLNLTDSTYFDGAQQAKFLPDHSLSIYIPDKLCPPGHIYHLRLLKAIGEIEINGKTSALYIFPQPATGTFTVLLPGLSESSELELEDLNGRTVIKKEFSGHSEVDVRALPGGVYMVHIKGKSFSLNKRVVLTN
jgi:hypothetical protein